MNIVAQWFAGLLAAAGVATGAKAALWRTGLVFLLAPSIVWAQSEKGEDGTCVIDSRCSLEGRLSVFDYGDVIVEVKRLCIALAIPESSFARVRAWDGRRVVVTGRAFAQPEQRAGEIMTSYRIEGRLIRTNFCESGLVVDTLRSKSKIIQMHSTSKSAKP